MTEHIKEIRTFRASDDHKASLAEALHLACEERCEVMLTLAESGSGAVTLSIDGHAKVDVLLLRLKAGYESAQEATQPALHAGPGRGG